MEVNMKSPDKAAPDPQDVSMLSPEKDDLQNNTINEVKMLSPRKVDKFDDKKSEADSGELKLMMSSCDIIWISESYDRKNNSK
jgi:hypothetical protein